MRFSRIKKNKAFQRWCQEVDESGYGTSKSVESGFSEGSRWRQQRVKEDDFVVFFSRKHVGFEVVVELFTK